VATLVALAVIADAGEKRAELLKRHQSGDRGTVPFQDARETSSRSPEASASSAATGWRGSERVWIIPKPTAPQLTSRCPRNTREGVLPPS